MRTVLLLLVLSILAAPVALAQPAVTEVDALFARWNTTTPGCAAGVAVDGRVVFARGYGMADLERRTPITPATIFEVGSVSKPVTVHALLMLVADGRLALDADIRMRLPELREHYPAISIRQLLWNTSGVRDYQSIRTVLGERAMRYNLDDVLRLTARQRALNFAPGTQWAYSNTNYALAALLVERAGGVPFREFTRQRLFEPLGMASTSWAGEGTPPPTKARGYTEGKGGYSEAARRDDVPGPGGLTTTIADMLTWDLNLTTTRVGDPSLLRLQQTAGSLTTGTPHRFGFGMLVGDSDGVRTIDVSGTTTAGYRAHLVRYLDPGISVMVMCNLQSAPATQYARAIGDLFLRGRNTTPRPRTAGASRSLDPSSIYREVTTGLVLRTPGTDWTTHGDQVRATDVFGNVRTYEPVPRATYSVAELGTFAGTYVNRDTGGVLSVSVAGNSLALTRRNQMVSPLIPQYANAFAAPELGLPEPALVTFARDPAGRIQSLGVRSERLWNLEFERQQPRSR